MTETTAVFKMILTDKWDERTAKLVGQIAIAYAQLEHVLWLGPKRIDKMPFSVRDAMAGRMTIPQRCEQVADAYAKKHLSQEKEAELDGLLKQILEINDERNSIMHGRWGARSKTALSCHATGFGEIETKASMRSALYGSATELEA
jgi:hypothetical protein